MSAIFFVMSTIFIILSCECKEADFPSLFEDQTNQDPCSGYSDLEDTEIL